MRPGHIPQYATSRGLRRLRAGAAWALLAGCAPAPKPAVEANPSSNPHGVAAADAAAPRLEFDPSGEPAEPKPTPTIRFAPAPATVAPDSAAVEIVEPRQDALITEKRLRTSVVRLRTKNWPISKPGPSVLLALDTFRPRNVHALVPPLRLTDLVDEDAELEHGPHQLVAMLARAHGETVKPDAASPRPFASVRFWLETRGVVEAGGAEEPVLVYNLPRGTYNGEAAGQAVLLDFFLIGEALAKDGQRVRVAITGQSTKAETTISEWRPLLIMGLSSGDYSVRLDLVGAHGEPVVAARASAERMITVNLDAPVGKRE
ncbi:MAG TPA: hypothetical protein VI072_34415 [Polyangiaceae bacterium]